MPQRIRVLHILCGGLIGLAVLTMGFLAVPAPGRAAAWTPAGREGNLILAQAATGKEQAEKLERERARQEQEKAAAEKARMRPAASPPPGAVPEMAPRKSSEVPAQSGTRKFGAQPIRAKEAPPGE